MGEGGHRPGEGDRANRFSQRSLARSKLKRNGLKAGTPAPDFRLPRLDSRGELALADLKGKRVLLVFSSPHCGPCNTLAPQLEKFQRQHPELEVLMISKRARAKTISDFETHSPSPRPSPIGWEKENRAPRDCGSNRVGNSKRWVWLFPLPSDGSG